MQLQRTISLLAVFFLAMSVAYAKEPSVAEDDIIREPEQLPADMAIPHLIRVPAKLYGAAYTIKVALKRDGTEFLAPFWIKPDEPVSSIDLKQFEDLGWYFKNTNYDELRISGKLISSSADSKIKFKNSKSAWAHYPQFPRTCCSGILGQDFLKLYRIKFDPKRPTHLDLLPSQESASPQMSTSMKEALKPLFNITSDRVNLLGKKVDLSEDGYWIDFTHHEFTTDPIHWTDAEKKRIRTTSIFKYEFIPPWRRLKVTWIDPALVESAKKVNFKVGMVVSELNSAYAFFTDEFEVERILKGRRDAKLKLAIAEDKRPIKWRYINFDFDTREFTP